MKVGVCSTTNSGWPFCDCECIPNRDMCRIVRQIGTLLALQSPSGFFELVLRKSQLEQDLRHWHLLTFEH